MDLKTDAKSRLVTQLDDAADLIHMLINLYLRLSFYLKRKPSLISGLSYIISKLEVMASRKSANLDPRVLDQLITNITQSKTLLDAGIPI